MNRITSRWLNLKGIHWLFRIKLLIFVTLSALYLKTNSLELQHPQEHSKVLNHEDMCYSVLFCVFSLVHMAGCATWPPCAAISGFSQRLVSCATWLSEFKTECMWAAVGTGSQRKGSKLAHWEALLTYKIQALGGVWGGDTRCPTVWWVEGPAAIKLLQVNPSLLWDPGAPDKG